MNNKEKGNQVSLVIRLFAFYFMNNVFCYFTAQNEHGFHILCMLITLQFQCHISCCHWIFTLVL